MPDRELGGRYFGNNQHHDLNFKLADGCNQGLEGCLVELADDINLFRSLAEADRPLTADEVAEKSNAFPGFIRK